MKCKNCGDSLFEHPEFDFDGLKGNGCEKYEVDMTTKQPDDQAARGGEYEIKTPITTKYMERGLMIFVDDDGAIIHPQDICNAINQAAAEQRSEQPAAEGLRDNYRTVLENHGATFAKDGRVLTMPFYPAKPEPAEPLGDVCETDFSDALDIAKFFHYTYERLAPTFGYETREDTKQFYPDSPNGKLMAAVCAEFLANIRKPAPNPQAVEADVDLRTTLAYEAGQQAERLRIAEELVSIRNSARNDAQEWLVNINELIEKLRGEHNGK